MDHLLNPVQMKAVSKDLLNAVLEHPGLRSVRVQCMDEQRRFGRRKVSATFAFTSMGRFGRSNICKHHGGEMEDGKVSATSLGRDGRQMS